MRINQSHNPFSTHCVRPGALPYLGDSIRISEMVSRWRQANCIGQIVGPHGVGKTTLTRAMEAFIGSGFGTVIRLTIRNRNVSIQLQQRLDFEINRPIPPSGGIPSTRRLYIIDGLERINRLNRWLLIQNCKSAGFGLLITSHRQLHRIPLLAEIVPSVKTLRQVTDHLLSQNPLPATISRQWDARTINAAFQQADGNLREALMLLYDEFEIRRQALVQAAESNS